MSLAESVSVAVKRQTAVTQSVDATSTKPARRVLTRLERAERFWGWVMVLPLLIGLLVFYFVPFLQNIFYSFTDLDQFMHWTTFNLDNYRDLFTDDDFYSAIFNTLFYVLVCVPISLTLSLLLAIGLNQNIRGKALFRTLLFLPAVTMPAAVAMVWQWLFNKDFGLINYLLHFFNVSAIGWLSDPEVVRLSVSIIIIWSSLALKIIILLAGLQNIPKSIYEAADIDGIGTLRRFFCLTLPMMVPTLFFVSVMSFIEVLQIFDVIYLMFNRSMVENDTMTITYLFFKNAFYLQEKGYASAITVVLFIVTMLITLIQMAIGKRLKVA
ncbi:carbohydrate ABC transporter permease [Rouxiella badensis]|jgi:multiple sugar transport system permease protein|uniref:Sugar ABC transporter permease n=1 Tax=Rouxiella badensis TaxID=1646377 RepID=A0A1X0WAR0_9GAMM|nr:sugar ABC transporter permease [Rouxiella badensis]MCC3704255.1 sugar ABC transporter permease [Rouxiella badensis]MCC3719706.1 sugar ABC transporter permease [Rouxiella badensis]MCC3728956.1 sugar ABC transporter permease [Rouxiella badensis]MCC3733383.1 sugar ABC transporter permease [Rouxiella badensis]MCC3740848.1 sugar ABC transporter permease [Rouxiella badensis]